MPLIPALRCRLISVSPRSASSIELVENSQIYTEKTLSQKKSKKKKERKENQKKRYANKTGW